MEKNYPNSGVLFSQKVKKSLKAPDYSGNIVIDVKDFVEENGQIKIRLAGWKKVSKNGNTFLSLKADMDRKQTEAPRENESESDEDLPF
jgi:predicted RNA-binding protein with RPS1 domain